MVSAQQLVPKSKLRTMSSTNLDQQRFLGKHQDLEIDKLFRALVKLEGSDLHLKVGLPPFVRIHGTLRPLNRDVIDDEEMTRLIFPMINLQERRKVIFEEDGGVDFAYTVDVDGKRWRFRVNVLQQMGHVGLVARRVNNAIPDFEHLYLPPSLADLCTFAQGMILLAASPAPARAPPSPRCSTGSTTATASTSSPWKTPSNSPSPRTSA